MMQSLADIVVGVPVSIEQMLAARERRAARQSAALALGMPIVSATIVMPGPIKDGAIPPCIARLVRRSSNIVTEYDGSLRKQAA